MIVSVASWFTFVVAASGADPPVEKMLGGLRESRYYDLAIPYLEQMREHPDCPAAFKDRIDYEIGVTLLEAADATETVSQRETTLDRATAAIQKFLQEHPTHEMAGPASTQIGRVLLLRGAVRVQQAELPGVTPADKNAKLAEAREFFGQAQSALEGAENRCYEKARELKDLADKDRSERSKQKLEDAYGELLQARLLLVNIADRRARTNSPDSKEYREQLEAAARRYSELFEKNEERIGGLQARNFEGKVYCDLDQNDKAIGIFREMLTLPDGSGAIRNLKRQALLWLMETLLKANVKKYDEAIEVAAKWKDDALPNEQTSSEGLRIQLLAGQACLEAAKALDPKDGKRRDLIRSARRYLEFVQRAPGTIRKEAGNLLMDDLLGATEVSEADPKTFEEAFEQANVAWLRMLTTDGQMRQATDSKQEEELASQVAAARESAGRYCRLALEMANKQTDLSQVNTVRFYLTFLYFMEDRLYDSAVMGELLAYRYPQSSGARKGAEIAIKAYRKLFDTERRASRDTSFEMAQMQRVAQYVTARWQDDPAAEEAWVMLFDTAVDLQDIEKATEYMEKLPPDSARRAGSELRLGQMYWAQYVRQAMLEEGERPGQEELDGLVKKAQETLRQGIDRMSKAVDAGGEVGYPLAYSVLALAQILIDAGNAEEAGRWLDDPKIGPMTLIAANNPAVAGRTDFQIDTYKAALRAYVGTEKLDQAETVMRKLEELVGHDDETGASRLTQIYISLGRQLEDLLTRLRAEGKSDQIQKVSQGFEKFLDTISKRERGNSFSSLNWVAQTFSSLAAGHDPGDGPLPEAAVKYYESAGATYYKLLKNPPADMPPGGETTIKVQLAVCLRALGRRQDEADPKKAEKNFTQALGLLVGILKERETRVDVQMEAARTYQELARASGQSSYYLNAILGGQKQTDGRYLVWGWNGISRRVGSRDEFRPIFYEARYNIALCRMRLAQTQTGAERTETLKLAENDILVTYKLYPSLGGPDWFEKYDALLKAVRRFQGNDNPQGLKGDA
jgi:tetratricopeptide (TPR) repeat protein